MSTKPKDILILYLLLAVLLGVFYKTLKTAKDGNIHTKKLEYKRRIKNTGDKLGD
jgi:hypothetical protein